MKDVAKQRPITLLTVRTKWVTLVIKKAIDDCLQVVVPAEQRGFMLGRDSDKHLHAVMHIQ